MEWRHNIVVTDEPVVLLGIALSSGGDALYTLWMGDPGRGMRRLRFDAQGQLVGSASSREDIFDVLLPHSQGCVLVCYKDGAATLTGYSADHRELWKSALPDADSPRWSLAENNDGSIHILYSSCNPHDAHRQAHVVKIVPGGQDAATPFFTVPEDDFPLGQLLIPQPERLSVCVRSRGAATVFYVLDSKGEISRSGAFSAHPHSKWAVPLCHTPLHNGDILMGGYQEKTPGRRQAWVCRFDADLDALNGKVVAGEHAEQAVTALAPQPDGTVLALCPPWRILRFSSKGLLTHVWEVPSTARHNSLTAMLAAPGGGCFIAGRSFTNDGDPAAWLGKIALDEFTEL